jgi:hypothetical protein
MNGSGGAAGTTASPCESLPAPGTWESIAPFSADCLVNNCPAGVNFGQGFSEAITVDPFDSAIVWFGTGSKGFFKSTDCGATFTHMNAGSNGAEFEQGNHISMLVDPVDPGVIYVANIHYSSNLWKSTNGGVDWNALFPPDSQMAKVNGGNADAISMDPKDHQHLMVGFHANCAAPHQPACEAETFDGGATWKIIELPMLGGWEEGAGPWLINATTSLWSGKDLWLTTDSGASWKQVNSGPSAFWGLNGGEVEIHPIQRDKNGNYYLTAAQGVITSPDGLSWAPIPNSGGRKVGLIIGGGKMYAFDQWSASLHVAKEIQPLTWTSMTPPPSLPDGFGCPYLDYDPAHHLLYASCYGGGLWRIVVE